MGLGGLQPGVWNNEEGQEPIWPIWAPGRVKYFEGHFKNFTLVNIHTYCVV